MLLVALMIAGPDMDAAIATYRARVAVDRACAHDPNSTDITICGRRNADRFRVPFVVHDPGDPRYESVSEERNRLLHRTQPIDDRGPFLIGGGMVGVSASIGADGSITPRKLAP